MFIETEFIYSGTPAGCSSRMNYQSLTVQTGIIQTLHHLYSGVQVSALHSRLLLVPLPCFQNPVGHPGPCLSTQIIFISAFPPTMGFDFNAVNQKLNSSLD